MKTYARGDTIGPYVVDTRLPKGGMAEVYIVRPRPGYSGPSPVAIKIAELAHNDFLKYEADYMRHINHSHILKMLPIAVKTKSTSERLRQYFTAKAEPNNPRSPYYIVMEYMLGGSLERYVRVRQRLNAREAVQIALQVADALAYIHAEGIVHLDIKPSNILLREPIAKWQGKLPHVVISDFGISQRIGGTQYEKTRGTPPYTAPERLANYLPHPQNDVFALGVVLYEMLTGHLPYNGPVFPSAPPLQPKDYPSRLNPSVGAALDQIVLHAIAPNPQQRYPSVAQMQHELRQLPQAHSHSTLVRGVPNWVPLVAGSVLVVVLLLGVAVGLVANADVSRSEGNATARPESAPAQTEPTSELEQPVPVPAEREETATGGPRTSTPLPASPVPTTPVPEPTTAPPPAFVSPLPVVPTAVLPTAEPPPAALPTAVPPTRRPPTPVPQPQLVTVPSVIGLLEGDAFGSVSNAGLGVNRREGGSGCAPFTIVSQSPPPGSRVEQGSTVTYTVCPQRTVPNVVGLDESEARAILEGQGFSVNVETYGDNRYPNGYVGGQIPGPGQAAPANDVVVIKVVEN